MSRGLYDHRGVSRRKPLSILLAQGHHPQLTDQGPPKKLRSACNKCHQAKTKCTGGNPCASCASSGDLCQYSVTTRTGRPKGAKNKKTQAQASASNSSKQTSEGESYRRRASPTESGSSSSLQQRPGPLSTSFAQPGQPSSEQSVLDFDSALFEAPISEGRSDELSYSMHSTALNDSVDYRMEDFLHGEGSVAPKAPDPSGAPHPVLPYGQEPFSPLGSHLHQDPRETNFPHDPLSNAIRLAALTPPAVRTSGDSYFLPNQELLASALSPLPYTPSSSALRAIERPTTCRCLEQHTELLIQLKNLAHGHSVLGIDAILTGVQQALVPWQSFVHCPVCPHNDDNSIILLSLMSIRVVLRQIQPICFGSSPPSTTSGQSTPDLAAPPIGLVSAGTYRPTQNEQRHMTDLLIVHALRKIKFALHALRGKFAQSQERRVSSVAAATSSTTAAAMGGVSAAERMSGAMGGRGGTTMLGADGVPISPVDSEPDTEVIHHLFENLDRTIHIVVNAVKERNAAQSQQS